MRAAWGSGTCPVWRYLRRVVYSVVICRLPSCRESSQTCTVGSLTPGDDALPTGSAGAMSATGAACRAAMCDMTASTMFSDGSDVTAVKSSGAGARERELFDLWRPD